jgi:hypothetical protein
MTDPRPRWAYLTPGQRDIAADLYDRTQALMASDGRMSIRQAMETAAIQAGHLPQILPTDGEEPA